MTSEEPGLVTTVTKDRTSTAQAEAHASTLWGHLRPLIPFAVVDVLSLLGAFWLYRIPASHLGVLDGGGSQLWPGSAGLAAVFVMVSVGLVWALRVRGSLRNASPKLGWSRIVGVLSLAAVFTSLLGLFARSGAYDPRPTVLVWAFSVFAVPLGESLAREVIKKMGGNFSSQTSLILVTTSESATIASEHIEQDGHRFRMSGSVGLQGRTPNGRSPNGSPQVIDLDDLPRVINGRANRNGGVLVAVPADKFTLVRSILSRDPSAERSVGIALYPSTNGAASESTSAIHLRAKPLSWQYEKLMRAVDVVLAVLALAVATPLMVLIAIAIKLGSEGPVFFNQIRVGRHGQLFKMYKFRSMREGAEELLDHLQGENEATGPMFKMSRDPRTTWSGAIIRRFSLDEVPQLFNVVQGTMSIVGPRPPFPHEVEEYETWHFQRFEARPGITG
ncbi:MAG: sugar transferase, partial [Acidobacteriota bacterium]